MKKLDEVIEMAEHCWKPMPEGICDTCPSKQRAGNCHLLAQALHYLKEYRDTDKNYKRAIAHVTEVIDHYEKMVADYLAVNNPPLDYETLRTMVGKPVWVELQKCGNHWVIITDDKSNGLVGRDMFGINVPLYKDRIGKTWNAYRKER